MIFAIGDLHFPFVHKGHLTKVLDEIKKKKPKLVIQVGDLFDMFSFSHFPRDVNIMTPRREVEEAWAMASEFWSIVKLYAPKSERVQLLGNHDLRPFKRLVEKLPESLGLHTFNKLFEFDGVYTHFKDDEEFIRDGICFMHGYKTQLGAHMRFNRMNTVCGHSHRAGTVFENCRGEIIWESNAGYLADPTQSALKYRPQRWSHWTHGYLEIEDKMPKFVLLP